MKSILTCYIFCIFSFSFLLAQEKSFSGILIDIDENPISNAEVFFNKNAAKATTDSQGGFILKLIPSSIQKLCDKKSELLSIKVKNVKYDIDRMDVQCDRKYAVLMTTGIRGKKMLLNVNIDTKIAVSDLKVVLAIGDDFYEQINNGKVEMSHKTFKKICNNSNNIKIKVYSKEESKKTFDTEITKIDCASKSLQINIKEKENNNVTKAKEENTEEVNTKNETKIDNKKENKENKAETKTDTSEAKSAAKIEKAPADSTLLNMKEIEGELAILVDNQGKKFQELEIKDQEAFIKLHIKRLEAQNITLEEQILKLSTTLKTDNTLSDDEKLDLTEQLRALKHKLHLNKLAVFQLHDRLSDLNKSFWQRYQTTLLIFGLIVLALGSIAYLLAILAKKRRQQRDEITQKNKEIEQQRKESETLLLNILPNQIAQELKQTGQVVPQLYPSASALFTDFHGFSAIAKNLKPKEVITELEYYFNQFETISEKFDLQKIKTMGDAFMAIAGLPAENKHHFLDAVCAALQMQKFISDSVKEKVKLGLPPWNVRIGVHTGELVAGVIGKTKFAYDVWGNSVNLAARMESSGESGKVQITENTYQLIKNYFDCTLRGEIEVKNIGKVQTYFVDRLKKEYSEDGFEPNAKFWEQRNKL
ncbi:MAG: hypothetical protein EAZ85_14930 [Bacteroidetes bacterium]|nr:MAG: hypothetical protein EAZ85_14930 [Bacteroidota bacterium]TAG87035.1 MAG: hypothetical protein EAZ20_11525 [Bacteroidota bacterium]